MAAGHVTGAPMQDIQRVVRVLVVRLSWLSGKALVAQAREFKGSETCGHAMTGKGTPLKTSVLF